MAFFGISVPQASLDIARYLELAPKNLTYDRSARVYLATSSFSPLFGTSSSQRFLNELLASESGVLDQDSSFVGWRPPIAIVPTPGRTLSAGTLAVLIRAIRDRTGVRVLYQSLSDPEPSSRTLSPHAFAHDGFRWHVRAYCHKRSQFLDFVIARILEIEPAEGAGPGPAKDITWQMMVELILAPHPKLTSSHRKAIELDYGMVDGRVRLACRQALLFYLLNHLRLDSDSAGRPEALQIVLENRDAVDVYLKSA
jgi:predicted DNA-binding transcriptional regulator YafY